MRHVDGESLGAVGGDRVPEVDVCGHVGSGQRHDFTNPRRAVDTDPPDVEGAVVVRGGDLPAVAVADEPANDEVPHGGEATTVLACDDQVAG